MKATTQERIDSETLLSCGCLFQVVETDAPVKPWHVNFYRAESCDAWHNGVDETD